MKRDSLVIKELMKNYGGRMKSHGVKRKIMLWEFSVFFSHFLKRGFDVTASGLCLLLFSPVFLVTALLIVLEDRGPVFYSQTRVGKNGKHFHFYKFRSMIQNADALKDKLIKQNESQDGVIFKMKDDPRITRIGRFIRKYSVDELPQLYNVLIGEMSLVGPRPPLPREVSEYSLEDRKRLHVTPGITGIWQVSGRSEIPFKQQVELDKEYIKSKSIWKDILILLKTIPVVLLGKGAY